ncbi:topoisomerase DNA-binding C4 zinc finger domain-containing protein [Limihaloglobus sulfuriphilus]|uniref:topoisomerase DNA-binding C4 zinc finger domain-containing protein n=1 Tax=Limihaloglobus sulfuriphilus TaxID=1851148 RepID=UPI0011BAC962|nr:topoisomerase DNA-binding C4 zinc finger domain-containing protein [Limihaloglobus sulfuriphilus]
MLSLIRQIGLIDLTGRKDHIPACPKFGAEMVVRTAKQGENAGRTFFGCSKYPGCRGTVEIEG